MVGPGLYKVVSSALLDLGYRSHYILVQIQEDLGPGSCTIKYSYGRFHRAEMVVALVIYISFTRSTYVTF